MLDIQFCSNCEWTYQAITVAEPYANVGVYIGQDIQHSVSGADHMLKVFREVIDGTRPPLVDDTGNAWTLDVDAKTARLTCYYATPVQIVELPTAWLVDAVERWRDFLRASGNKQ
jgi:hypothetical protein